MNDQDIRERLRRALLANVETPPAAQAVERVRATVRQEPRRERRAGSPLRVVLAVVVTAALVAALLAVRHGVSSSNPPHPRPHPATSTSPVAPSPSPPTFLVNSGWKDPQWVRYDWNGERREIWQAPSTASLSAAPDGSLIEARGTSGVTSFYDTAGALVTTTDQVLGRWADDSRHLCSIYGGVATVMEIAGSRLTVTSHASVQGSIPDDQTLYRCSVSRDRALMSGLSGDTVLQPSTGRVLYQLSRPAGAEANVALDLRQLAWVTRTSSTIVDFDTGATLATVLGAADGFSGDGALVAYTTPDDTCHVEEWATGREVWSSRNACSPSGIAQPGGRGMVLMTGTVGGPTDTILLTASGQTVDLGAVFPMSSL